jgi:hypothetical protein
MTWRTTLLVVSLGNNAQRARELASLVVTLRLDVSIGVGGLADRRVPHPSPVASLVRTEWRGGRKCGSSA